MNMLINFCQFMIIYGLVISKPQLLISFNILHRSENKMLFSQFLAKKVRSH